MKPHEFVIETSTLAGMTTDPKWDEWETTPVAKPIGLVQWREAIAVAGLVVHEVPNLEYPKPGADPEGFPWLSWADLNGAEFKLAVRPSLTMGGRFYTWAALRDGCRRGASSSEMRDVIEALRATFVIGEGS